MKILTMWKELGNSSDTAKFSNSFYFVIKWAVRNGLKRHMNIFLEKK